MDDKEKWRRRFLLFFGARLFGLLTVLAGVAIMLSDLLRPGGWPLVGAIVAVLGLVDAFVAPNLLKKQWKKEDESQ